jgi:hypothetical protein
LIFLTSFVFGIISPQLKSRRKMMALKCIGDWTSALYLLLMGGHSGACAAAIAGTGACIQSLTPHKYLRHTKWFRMGVALILSAARIYFVYKTPTDLLPITMVIICRFGELQPEAQRIRLVYLLTCFPWMLYHYLNDFYLPLFACIILSGSLAWSMVRYRHPPTEDIQK